MRVTDFAGKIFPDFSRPPEKFFFRIFCESPKVFEIILKIRERKKIKNISRNYFHRDFE